MSPVIGNSDRWIYEGEEEEENFTYLEVFCHWHRHVPETLNFKDTKSYFNDERSHIIQSLLI